MEIWHSKVIALISMFFIAFLSGLASILLVDVIRRRRCRRQRPQAGSFDGDAADSHVTSRQHVDAVAVDCGAAETVTTAASGRHVAKKSLFSSVLSSTTSKTSKTDGDVEELVLDGSDAACGTTTAERVLSLLNCFAGGVFLATSLLHLLPDVRKDMSKAVAAIGRLPIDFPIAEFITCIGFFIVMLIEQVHNGRV